MRKIFCLSLVLILLGQVLSAVQLDDRSLWGIKFVRTRCYFNGVPVYKGYKTPTDTEVKEFNGKLAEDKLKEDEIPITLKDIRTLYTLVENYLENGGLEILEITGSGGMGRRRASVIPIVDVGVQVKSVVNGHEFYVAFIYVAVTKWYSTWEGTRNIHIPAIAYLQKSFTQAEPEELKDSITRTIKQLMTEFINRLKIANSQKEELEKAKAAKTEENKDENIEENKDGGKKKDNNVNEKKKNPLKKNPQKKSAQKKSTNKKTELNKTDQKKNNKKKKNGNPKNNDNISKDKKDKKKNQDKDKVQDKVQDKIQDKIQDKKQEKKEGDNGNNKSNSRKEKTLPRFPV
jgi:hypothetical protein